MLKLGHVILGMPTKKKREGEDGRPKTNISEGSLACSTPKNK
jgi:hypothetical protein